MIGRNPISRFAALAMGGIVVLTLAWTLAAGWLAVPVSGMSKWVLENAANGWVQRVDLETPRSLVVNSSVQVSNEQTGWRRAEAIVEVDPARYGYGLPVLVAMLLAAWGPGRWWRILVGYVALLPLQTFSVVSQVLMQLCLAARLDLNVLGIQTWQLEAIVYAYQMGGLMVPTLCPVLLWLALDMGFVRRVLLPAWNRSRAPAAAPQPMVAPKPSAWRQTDGAATSTGHPLVSSSSAATLPKAKATSGTPQR
ncbi:MULTISPECIES: exosortase H-associated membrane protein [Delftia]|uniref:exosortase H-associated membrane protein n=1 Tax=Delftia TaxID=80865 RepID=UPI00020E884F|nr:MULTISPECIES: exosortase H-associated membrane protein [Delftia]AEF92308.1 hypothetical protein DelCs14_5338 [Delftia sp. Cs1-4]MCA1067943.1 hypothetical protein [Delftia acidovorans]MCG8989425.1 hypothetical protein [Delftia acidovorans]OWG14639.1 hypothetical protein KDK82_3886 [Delftia sp. K82]ROQ91446.1 hypothetical protein EDF72_4016 [Delftia acidovorans]